MFLQSYTVECGIYQYQTTKRYIRTIEMNKELMNILVPAVLFIVLTPGLLFTLPSNKNSRIEQTLTHVVIFIAAYATLRQLFKQYY